MTNTLDFINSNPCTVKDFSVVTFMTPAYFNLEKSYHDIAKHMYVFIHDKQKVGILSDKQQQDATNVLGLFIPHGYPVKNLNGVNITPYFEMSDCEGFSPAKEVNVGIYNLDNNTILSNQMRWDAQHPCINPRCADESDDMRIALYTECEAIGKTLKTKGQK